MSWEHLRTTHQGSCWLQNPDGEQELVATRMAAVETGRSRTFWGYRVVVQQITGEQTKGEDRHNLHNALKQCDENLRAAGYQMKVMGLRPDFYETGLSFNSGYGYVDDVNDPVHMLDSATNQGEGKA